MSSTLRPVLLALLAALVLGTTGCLAPESRPAAGAVATPASAAVCDRLYFGRTIPRGGVVTEAQWTAFVATEIASRFPSGFTIYQASGHWRGDDGVIVSEPATVLEVVHPVDAASDRALDHIARAYCERFHQEAVMHLRHPAEQKFLRR